LQEEVEGKAVTLIISVAKLTGSALRQAISRYMESRKGKGMIFRNAGVQKQGKQSVKSLMRQGAGLTSIEINDKQGRAFRRITRKYGIDYSIKKVKGAEKPTYQVYIKAKDKEIMTEALSEFIGKKVKVKGKNVAKPSVLQKLNEFKEKVAGFGRAAVRHKELER
jgi:hypothetical protein